VALTYQATDLLALEDYPDERDAFLADVRGKERVVPIGLVCLYDTPWRRTSTRSSASKA
jgi:hypothetical protein